MKESKYAYDDPNIPDEYYDSDEWLEYEEAIRKSQEPVYHMPVVAKIYTDTNWAALKAEQLQPPPEDKSVAKIANCKFQIWLDTYRISATYDIAYASGRKVFGRRASGTWDKEEAKTSAEARALDAVVTMVARSQLNSKVNFSRMHEVNSVKNVIREITLIELNHHGEPVRGWFVIGDTVYPARYNHTHVDRYEWCFNGKKKMSLDRFCDMCWEAVK